MKYLLVLAVLAVVLWLVLRSRSDSGDSSPTEFGNRANNASESLKSGASFTLKGTTCRLSGNGRIQVVGESFRRKDIERAFKGKRIAAAGDWENALQCDAILVPEPTNKFDRNAVRVLVEASGDWVHVGYLSAEDAVRYVGVCNALIGADRIPLVAGRVVRSSNGLAVYLHLGDSDSCVFVNDEPDVAVVAAYRECAVTRESHHQDVLEPLRDGLYWATLHPSTVTAGKSAGEFTLEVQIDGARVGELTSAQGSRYRPLLADGLPVACEASVFAGKSAREVTLSLPKVD